MTQENEKISINGRDYIPADSIPVAAHTLDGLRYAIVRSREQGVMCGYVKAINGRAVELYHARQIWRYDSTFVLPDIAAHGPRDPKKMQMSVAMTEPCIMLEACGVMYCSDAAGKALRNVEAVKK